MIDKLVEVAYAYMGPPFLQVFPFVCAQRIGILSGHAMPGDRLILLLACPSDSNVRYRACSYVCLALCNLRGPERQYQ